MKYISSTYSPYTHTPVSNLFCPLNSETVRACKKKRLGQSRSAVSPPGGLAHINAPPSWVITEKCKTPHFNTPVSGTSGRASWNYTRHVFHQNIIHDPRYTCYVSCTADTSYYPKDAAGSGESSDNGKNKKQCSNTADGSTSKRHTIQNRSALFNGSRNTSICNGGDDGGDDERNKKGSQIPNQCEASLNITQDPKLPKKKEDGEDSDEILENYEVSHCIQPHPQKPQIITVNSTQTNHSISVAGCPNDTSGGDGSNEGKSSSHSSSADDSKTKRNQVKSRGALFNGSRNSSLSSSVIALKEPETENSSPKNAVLDRMSLTLKEHNDTSQRQNVQAITANSTQIDHSQLANPMFDMSVLHGISKISYSFWESAKNVSLLLYMLIYYVTLLTNV